MLLIGASLVMSVWRFLPVFTRLVQAFVDMGLSVAYYFTELSGFEGLIMPTVGTVPDGIESVLPLDLEVFKAQLSTYGNLIIDKQNLV